MALAANAFVTLAEFKAYLNALGSTQEAQLENAINTASTLLETRLKRQIVTRGNLTEFHSPQMRSNVLFLGDYPVIAVASVNEDSSRIYGAGTVLVVDTDYVIIKDKGELKRTGSGGGAWLWFPGFRTVKVVYSAGYAVADVPADIKGLCLELAAVIYKEADRQRWGVSNVTDSLGNMTRYAGYFTPDIRDRIALHERREFAGGWDRE